MDGGEVMHPVRPGCMLRLMRGDAAVNFLCDGCRVPGRDTRWCTSVDNQHGNLSLHTHCALATPTLQHPLVNGTMDLRLEAPAGGGVCSACFDTLRGLHYYCSRRTSKGEYPKLHPCCAKLPVFITMQSDTFELREEVKHRCTFCRQMEGYYRPWCYRSTINPDQRMYLHIKCIKEVENAGDDEERMMVRLQERAGRNVRLERRVCKTLVILVRVVVRLLIGDPTPIFTEGVNAIVSMAMQ